MSKVAIIPSAGNPQNSLFPGIYDPMIPVNGKPTIDYILEQNKKWGANKFVVILNKLDVDSYLYLQFRKNHNLIIIVQDESISLGHSVYQARPYVGDDDEIIINLGDTIFVSDSLERDIILTSNKEVSNPSKWCFVDESMMFFDKPISSPSGCAVVSGIYAFSDSANFFEQLVIADYNFYRGIESYHKNHQITQILATDNWYDLGHIDEYYKSKVMFLRTRSFNSLEYDSFRGIITKKSKNQEKLRREINWFMNMPNDLKIFMPRLVDYCTGEKVSYALEFYGYQTLADSFIFGNYPLNHRMGVINRLIEYIDYVRIHYPQPQFPFKYIYDMYFEKTHDRISKIKNDPLLSKLLAASQISINGVLYDNNIADLLANLPTFIEHKIHRQSDYCILHGDMCFSNILYDTQNGIMKLIDPRGCFGEMGTYGDIKYDLAKIRHSLHGKYEYIAADLFNLEYDLDQMVFNYFYFKENSYSDLVEYFDNKCKILGFDVDTIKYIEGLLFLTMIPLHSDSIERQIMMYLIALQIFNGYIVHDGVID